MRPKRLIVFLLLFSLLLSPSVRAEHLFEIGGHGGAAGWTPKPDYVRPLMGFNAGAHFCYNYLSPHIIGFRAGVMLDCHNAGFGKQNYEDHYATKDVENELMEVDYTIGNLSERYTTWSVGVPLQIAVSTKNILFLAGAKAVFPLGTSWKQTVEHAALSVYFPAYDNRVEESYPLAASRDFDMAGDGKLQLPKVQWWLATELSYMIPVKTVVRRYRSYVIVGAYFDYCFTKFTPDQSRAESLIMLTDTRNGFPLQRVLTPVMEANRQGSKLVSACSLFDVGIKLSYAIAPYDTSRRQKSPCRCNGVYR